MDFFIVLLSNFQTRLIICSILILVLVGLFISLIRKKDKYYAIRVNKAIIDNLGTDSLGKELPLYKNENFLLMVNDGEDLCKDDISFDYSDYCGNVRRMYYNGGAN